MRKIVSLLQWLLVLHVSSPFRRCPFRLRFVDVHFVIVSNGRPTLGRHPRVALPSLPDSFPVGPVPEIAGRPFWI